MIDVARLHEQFRNSVNRLNSNYNKTFAVRVIDSYLNKAQDAIIEHMMSYAEINTKMRNHLRVLEIKEALLPLKSEKIESVVCALPDNYYRALRQYAMISCTYCDEIRKIPIHNVQTDDLDEALYSPYWEPSYEWRYAIGDESYEGYHVFITEEMIIHEVRMDYLRKPREMAAYSLSGCSTSNPYIGADGSVISSDMHCEFSNTYLWRYIADLAAYFALRDLGQADDASTKAQEMIFSKITQLN